MPRDGSPPDPHHIRTDLRDLLTLLVKIALVGPQGEAARWRAEAVVVQERVRAAAREAADLPLDNLWTASVRLAERDPAVRRDEIVNPTLSTTPPLGTDRLCAVTFDLEAAVQAIRDAASSG